MQLLYLVSSCITLSAAMPFALRRQNLDCTSAAYSDIILTGFNIHRANHSAPDLVWNDTLASAAETTTTTGVPGVHDNGNGDWGQNLYYGGGDGFDTPGDAINWWYNGEFSNYDTYGDAAVIDIEANPPVLAPPPATPGAVYGHFTQTVWVGTATVGCHTAPRDDLPDGSGGTFSGTYTACNFYPPGNWVTSDTSYEDNVLPPLGQDVVGAIC